MKCFFFSVFALLLISCTSKYGIANASAYVRNSVAGTIRTNNNGAPTSNGETEEHLIFIETDTAKPLPFFTSAWVRGKPYSVQLVEMNQQLIGKTSTGNEVRLTPKKGHKIWQAVLTSKEKSTATDVSLQQRIQQNIVVLTGKWKEKEFTYSFNKEQSLEPIKFQ